MRFGDFCGIDILGEAEGKLRPSRPLAVVVEESHNWAGVYVVHAVGVLAPLGSQACQKACCGTGFPFISSQAPHSRIYFPYPKPDLEKI